MNFLKSWGLMRVLRLVLGIFAIVQAFITLDIVIGILGLGISGMAFLNVGCCGSNGCSTNSNTKISKQQITDVEYEEVVVK
jgi:hypothetical protein